jgi:hypothetical protein
MNTSRSSSNALEDLAWQVAMGADEAIEDAPQDRRKEVALAPLRVKPTPVGADVPAAPSPSSVIAFEAPSRV